MLGRSMEVMVDTIMSNHIYQFDSRVFRQVEGGPIGLEITGVLARLVMLWWDGKFLAQLQKLKIPVWLYLRYVDDYNLAIWAFPPGTRIQEGKLTIQQEEIENDLLIPDDRRTALLLKEVANQISPMIEMKEDVSSNYPNGKLPILDLEVWVEENTIFHSFYKKPMASRRVVFAKSALPTKIKRSILLEEGKRRLKNCSPNLDWEKKVIFLNRLSSDMKNSGHSINFRAVILKRVIARYISTLSNHQEGVCNMYRSSQERIDQKKTTSILNQKYTWFRAGGATSTLCVPPTPRS